jgi:hypothetical protein
MKKVFFLGGILVLLAGGAYLWMNETNKSPHMNPQSIDNALVTDNGLRLLNEFNYSLNQEVSFFVLGHPITAKSWAMRGTISGANGDRPFYGTVDLKCEKYDLEQCWGLSELFIDGKIIPLPDTPTKTELAKILAKTPPKKAREAMPTAPIIGLNERTVRRKRQATLKSEPASLEVSAKPPTKTVGVIKPKKSTKIWSTISNSVNGRLGPGENFPIAFLVPRNVELKFLHKKDGWGAFEYEAEGNQVGKIWISLKFVKPKKK